MFFSNFCYRRRGKKEDRGVHILKRTSREGVKTTIVREQDIDVI